jgi:hypothetical protein
MSREARPTIRCLTEDLDLELPGLDVSLGDVNHPWLDELRRIADTSPQNQKRVLSIAYPLVYRLRISDERGATWVDEQHNTVWLCAVSRREEGSDDDAYEWFAQLHEAKALLPTEADLDRLRADAVLELFHHVSEELCRLVDTAVACSGDELREDLGGWLPCRALVIESQGTQEVWCALSVRDVENQFVREEMRNALFAALEAHLAPIITEARHDWPTGNVEWFEVVRLGVR